MSGLAVAAQRTDIGNRTVVGEAVIRDTVTVQVEIVSPRHAGDALKNCGLGDVNDRALREAAESRKAPGSQHHRQDFPPEHCHAATLLHFGDLVESLWL